MGEAMATKADFAPDEWRVLLEGPASAGVMVMAAERGGTFRENRSIRKAYAEARQQHGQSVLLDEIVSFKPHLDHARFESYEELSDRALQQLREATALLNAKSSGQELAEYRRFVVNLAERVAGAHTEGGEPVSEGERAAIDLIEEAMS
jgi:hypothetical protein